MHKSIHKKGDFRKEVKKNKTTFAVYLFLRLVVFAIMIRAFFRADFQSVFYCLLTLVLFMLPAFMENNFGIVLPTGMEITILCFIFAAEILGELRSYYITVPHWDTMLHTVNGFLCAAFGFSLVDILSRKTGNKMQLSPLYIAFVAFCFSMTIGVLWEFFEFGADMFLHTDMQKDTIINVIHSVALNPQGINTIVKVSDITDTAINGMSLGINGYLDIGLIDTMKDLFVNFIGAVVFSTIGYFYEKNDRKGKFSKNFIPSLSEYNKKIRE